MTEATPQRRASKYESRLFRIAGWLGRSIEGMFGLGSLAVLLAIASGIPGIQILTLGYLIEASGRIGRTGRVRSGAPGLRRAARLGSAALGTLAFLGPIMYVSHLEISASLIDPTSRQTIGLGILQNVLVVLLVPHILASWFCGGRLRHFFWPLVAPIQLSIWTLRWVLAQPTLRRVLDASLGRISQPLVRDLCLVRPLSDFFVPAILWKHVRHWTWYAHARDGCWSFLQGLHLLRLGRLGIQTLLGSIPWLFIPTVLLIGATQLEDGGAIASGLFGVLTLAFVAMYLPLLQTHYAAVGHMYALFDFAAVRQLVLKSPLRITLATVLFLALSIPLFALKIEQLDPAFSWLLGFVFIVFSLPARWIMGWAYARAQKQERSSRWYWRWPVRWPLYPLCLIFAGFVSVTRFTSWRGVTSLFEQHAFLIPAPFTHWFQ